MIRLVLGFVLLGLLILIESPCHEFLDPKKLNEDFNSKEKQREAASNRIVETTRDEKKIIREIKRKTKGDKKTIVGYVFSGKYDLMDYASSTFGGSGKAA